MEILENRDDLQAVVQRHPIVVVQFGAESCGPCKAIQNRIRKWNHLHPNVCHIYVDVVSFPEACAQLGVFTVPAVFVYAKGKPALQQSGYFSLDQMLQQAEKYEDLLICPSPAPGFPEE